VYNTKLQNLLQFFQSSFTKKDHDSFKGRFDKQYANLLTGIDYVVTGLSWFIVSLL